MALGTSKGMARKITTSALTSVAARLEQLRDGTFCNRYRSTAKAVEAMWPVSDARRAGLDTHLDHCISCRITYGYLRRAAALVPMPIFAVAGGADSVAQHATGVFAQLRESLASLWRSGAVHADTAISATGGGAGAAAAAGGGGATIAGLCAGAGGKVAVLCAAGVVAAGGAVGIDVARHDRPAREKTAKSEHASKPKSQKATIASVQQPAVMPATGSAAASSSTLPNGAQANQIQPNSGGEFSNLPESGGGSNGKSSTPKAPSAAAEFGPERPSSGHDAGHSGPTASSASTPSRSSAPAEFGSAAPSSSGASSPAKAPSAKAEFGLEG